MRNAKSNKALVVSILILLLMPFSRLMAEPSGGVRVPIYFRWNSEIYDPAILSNEASMQSLFAKVDSIGVDRIDRIEITGFSSPEGVYEFNVQLSLHRARNVAKILRTRYTPLARHIRVDAGGEAWDMLRERVASDRKMTEASRNKVLRFLDDTTISNDTRKWRLQNWLKSDPNVGELYPYLLRNHYRKLRSGVVVILYEKTDEVQPQDTVQQPAPADTSAIAAQPKDTAALLKEIPAQPATPDTTARVLPQDTLPQQPATDSLAALRIFQPIVGLSTNLIYDVTYVPGYGMTSIPSFGLEYYPVRGHWTYGIDVEWPMWKHWNSHRFMQINNITFSGRRYFREKDLRYRGLYLLGNMNVARYGIGFDKKGWEGEGLGASLGIGHKWLLGKSPLYLDLGVAVGAFYSGYDPYVYEDNALGWYYYDYDGKPEDFQKRNNRWFWVGPTRVWVSLGIDLFNRRVKE